MGDGMETRTALRRGDDAAGLRAAVEEAVRCIADDSTVVASWLALDCAEMLIKLAARDLRATMSPEKASALAVVAHDLRRVANRV